VSCRRIGRPRHDGIQPLLVSFDCCESASYFVSNAKKLRKSRNSIVREKVYISEDLTPSESKAAYEIRCRRREQLQTRQEQNKDMPTRGPPEKHGIRLVYRSQPPATNVDNQPVGRTTSDSTPMSVDPAITSSDERPSSPSHVVTFRADVHTAQDPYPHSQSGAVVVSTPSQLSLPAMSAALPEPSRLYWVPSQTTSHIPLQSISPSCQLSGPPPTLLFPAGSAIPQSVAQQPIMPCQLDAITSQLMYQTSMGPPPTFQSQFFQSSLGANLQSAGSAH